MRTRETSAATKTSAATILDQPAISLGRGITGDLEAALRREWLLTNGLGGYAMGTLAGVPTRRYHGWLVASLTPPVERTVLVAGLDEWLVIGERRMPLSSFEFGSRAISPDGWRNLESFELDGGLPVWRFSLGETLIERRAWMPHGRNATHIRYCLLRGPASRLEVNPLVTCRDHHSLRRGDRAVTGISADDRDAIVHFDRSDVRLSMSAGSGSFDPDGSWWWDFRHREEGGRGLDDRSDLYAAGTFKVELPAGGSVELTFEALGSDDDASATSTPDRPGAWSLEGEQERQRGLLAAAGASGAPPAVQQLVLAADTFLVERQLADGTRVPTVIAGYPWFNDWGRDTFVSLPGLTLATGRTDEAAAILRTFAGFLHDGLLPNDFPSAGSEPAYNTVDASLWYVIAVAAHVRATGDPSLSRELLPTLKAILDAYAHGTHFGIGADPADGLIRAGEEGLQLTWMDAKVGSTVITPRMGKPVEINALWYDALCEVATLCASAGDPGSERLFSLADQVARSFRRRFVRRNGGLRDVVDGPEGLGGDDDRIRPNQILAVSLPYPLLTGADAERVVDLVAAELLTSLGLRSLSPDDPSYRPTYGGGVASRDSAYHQGTVWSWLIGPFVEAYLKVHGDRAAARSFLMPFVDHLADAGLGNISEIFDAEAPFTPRGAIAQAWSVGEVLRAWSFVDPWIKARPRR